MENELGGEVAVILRNITEAVTVQGPDGRLIYANPAAAKLIGYPTVEALFASPISEVLKAFELLDEEGNPLPIERLPGRLALRGEEPPETLLRFRIQTTGEERWTLLNARPIFDESDQVKFAVNVFRDVTEQQLAFAAERAARARAETTQRQLTFLAEASDLLAQTLDYETTLRQVAQLAVPDIADWCAVDMLLENGAVDRLSVAHHDPARVRLAYELLQRYPPDPDASTGLYQVLRSGEPELYPDITDEMLVQAARDTDQLEIMRGLTLRSVLIVPLKARDRVLGALTIALAESGRTFSDADLALANQLATRAALAVDNARLYREATRTNEALEARVAARTRQLQNQKRQLALAQQIAHLGSWEWEIGAERVWWSDEMYRLADADPQTFVPTYEAMAEFYHPEDREAVLAMLDRVREEGWPGEFQCRLARANGQVRNIHLHCEPTLDKNGKVVRLMGTWQDVSELWQAESLNRTLVELGRKLNAVLDLDKRMDVLTKEAVGLLNAESGFAAYRGPEGLVAPRYSYKGKMVPIDQSWSPGEGIPGRVLETKQTYVTNDAPNDPQVKSELLANFALCTVLCAPILDLDGNVIGVIEVNNKRDGSPFNKDDVKMLASLTPMAGIAIHNAQLHERQRELGRQLVTAQEEERARLSRELHDSAGQLLTVLGIQLSMLAGDALEDEEQHRQKLREAAQLAKEAHDEIRAVSHALRPLLLLDGDLDDALRSLCDDFARQTKLKIVYSGEQVPRLPDTVTITLYRFLQETLSNVARHASAKAVEVTFRRERDELSISVADDGVGLNVTTRLPSTTHGVGLLGLQERFRLLEGDIIVISGPGKGTRVTGLCRLPNAVAASNST